MPTAEETRVSLCGKLGLKPITCHNVLFYYCPVQGIISYTSLSINVMNPSLVLRIFPRRDITNILLINTLVGTSLYLYNRKHLALLPKKDRILLSIFGSVTFSLGSVLVWAIIRSAIPTNIPMCTVCGLTSGLALLKLGQTYVEHVDNLSSEKSEKK